MSYNCVADSLQKCPQQSNGHDCGIHVLTMLSYVLTDKPLPDRIHCARSRKALLKYLRKVPVVKQSPITTPGGQHQQTRRRSRQGLEKRLALAQAHLSTLKARSQAFEDRAILFNRLSTALYGTNELSSLHLSAAQNMTMDSTWCSKEEQYEWRGRVDRTNLFLQAWRRSFNPDVMDGQTVDGLADQIGIATRAINELKKEIECCPR